VTERPDRANRSWPVRSRLMQVHVALYRATGGRIGHHLPGHPPMLLLEHVGAKTRKRRTSGLTYMPSDASFVVVGSNGGRPRNPGWVYNLRAFPDTEIQVGPDKVKVHAREADGDERQRLWPQVARYHPAWGRFQQHTQRDLPLVILTPRREA
jgi:F420H(2)-dependent quinone reductase